MGLVSALLGALFPPRVEPIAELLKGRRALVKGVVVARDLIDSTLTGETCVYYRYAVEEWRSSNIAGLGSDGHWAPVRFDEAIVEFYLQDEAGDRIIISPEAVRLATESLQHSESVEIGIVGQRASELLIRPGDMLEVEGLAEAVYDLFESDRGYRQNAAGLMLSAPKDESLSIRIIRQPAITSPVS